MITTRHWLTALPLALVLHLTGFAVVMAQSSNDGAVDQGEQGIEVDLGMLGDLGADSASRHTAAAVPASVPEPAPEPIPEPETLAQPEPVVPTQQAEVRTEPKAAPKPKPQPKSKPEPAAEQNPVTKPAPEANDSESEDQQNSRKTTTGKGNATPSGGTPGAQRSYFAKLAAHLAKHKRYPMASRRRGEEGIVKLFFELDRDGGVLSYRITESSGYERLDAAVIRMLESARPLPAFPPEMNQTRLSVNVPIAFAINDRR